VPALATSSRCWPAVGFGCIPKFDDRQPALVAALACCTAAVTELVQQLPCDKSWPGCYDTGFMDSRWLSGSRVTDSRIRCRLATVAAVTMTVTTILKLELQAQDCQPEGDLESKQQQYQHPVGSKLLIETTCTDKSFGPCCRLWLCLMGHLLVLMSCSDWPGH
jgi:hypothetical protein